MLHEHGRGEDGGQVVHQIGMILKQLWSLVLHRSFQTLSIGRRNPVPGLWLPPGVRERVGEGEGGRESERVHVRG